MITSLPHDGLRIGDQERQQAAAALAEHLAAGRMSLEEYDERIQAGYAARTEADLRPLFADLPSLAPVAGVHGRRHARPYHGGPSPVVLLIAVFLIAASVVFHVPLFPLIAIFWFRAAHRRHHHFYRHPIHP